ncbi:MAG: hypothetical protein ACWA40_03880 [Planktomarina sp.]
MTQPPQRPQLPSKYRRRRNVPKLVRTPVREWTFSRIIRGGPVLDAGRLPRYLIIILLASIGIWFPILSYLKTAPLRYTSSLSLILPGSGASSSVNLDSIGQASSAANSAFSSPSISPTVTYKKLLGAERIVAAAAAAMGMLRADFGNPRVELVDQTGFINVSIVGNSPQDAQARGNALLQAFFTEIDELRNDELNVREDSGQGAIEEYRQSVAVTRAEISTLQRQTGLISADQYQALVASTENLKSAVNDTRTKLVESERALAVMAATLGIDPTLASATLKLQADAEFTAFIEELSSAAAVLADARARYGSNHHILRDAQKAYNAAQANARARAGFITGLSSTDLAKLDLSPIGGRAELLRQLLETDATRAGIAAELADMETRLAEQEERVIALIEPAARLEDLQRDFSVAEAVFASAMARSKTSRTDLYASYPLVQVLENPSLPVSPSSPKKKLAYAAGIAAMFLVIMGLFMGWIRQPIINKIIAPKPKE